MVITITGKEEEEDPEGSNNVASRVILVIRSASSALNQGVSRRNTRPQRGKHGKIAGAAMFRILTEDRLKPTSLPVSLILKASTSDHRTRDLKASRPRSRLTRKTPTARNHTNS